ncbi:MAG TPA: hypothetical protein VNJ01_02110 [Bacteriovoracaceae bacterium]|nr:hypothetical protein [Bacteriovoracaceae bacterium]
MLKKLPVLFILFFSGTCFGQSTDQALQEIEDDMTMGSDIFSDFNEDLESAQVLEDERFYRYGRFFSVNLGGGFTTFTGNRGKAYEDNNPTFHLSVNYFLDFQKSITLGVEYSQHTMVLDTIVNISEDFGDLGLVNIDMTRAFVGYKYYLDTSDLGTAITYSNPHLIGRFEYWYQTTKFTDRDAVLEPQKGGGLGTALGGGLEFPLELKASYISVEALYHVVKFKDRGTTDFRQVIDDQTGQPIEGSDFGFEDLTGNVLSLIITYNFTW